MGFLQTLFGGSSSSSGSKVFRPQKRHLKNIYNEAESLYNSRVGTPWYEGDLYAGLNPTQNAGVQSLIDFANTDNGLYSNATQGALSAFGGGMPTGDNLQSIYERAGQDPTAGILSNAAQYADNPYISGMVDAASRDVMRNLTENELPGISLAAIGSGNSNSSRAGIAEGIAMRGAADRVGDISSQIRGNAYSQGLNTALAALNSNRATQLDAAGQQGGLLGLGFEGSAMANNLGVNPGNTLLGAGSVLQADQQSELDALYKRWFGNDTRDTDILSAYQGHIGSPIQNSFSNSSSSPGIMSNIARGIGSMALPGSTFFGGYGGS